MGYESFPLGFEEALEYFPALFKAFGCGMLQAVIFVPGAVWSVQLGIARGWRACTRVGDAIAVTQFFPACVAGVVCGLLSDMPVSILVIVNGLGLAVLVLLWVDLRAAPPVPSLEVDEERIPAEGIFRHTFLRSVGVSIRLPSYLAFFLAAGVATHASGWWLIPLLGVAAVVGSVVWWGLIALLVARFGQDKEARPYALRSMRKLQKLAGWIVVGLGLAIVANLAIMLAG